MLLLPLSFTANSALSATTAKVIEGTAPYLVLSDGEKKLTSLDELLGFSMPKRDGSPGTEQIDASMSGTTLTVPAGMKYSDVVALITADGANHNVTGAKVGDADGDADNPVNTSIAGKMTATWYKGSVTDANKVSDLTVWLSGGCDGATYKLVISAEDVEAKTTYGVPNSYSYGSSTPITYTFKAAASTGGCIKWLKPASMTRYTTGVSISGGYNAAKFDPVNGFKVDSGFPTTGFAGASFSLLGSSADQRLYSCKSDNAGTGADKEILLSGTSSQSLGANCTVTYKTDADHQVRPTKDITIVMQARSTVSSSDWADIDSFTIKKSQIKLWAIGMGQHRYKLEDDNPTTDGTFPAASMCKNNTTTSVTTAAEAKTYFFKRNELTNSPYANPKDYPELSEPLRPLTDRFSRDTDGDSSTFLGEWGYVQNYTDSGWASNSYYWTAEAYSEKRQFHVVTYGNVSASLSTNSGLIAMCRG